MSDISVSEAGRRGGSATRDRYGKEHYSRIGKMGGRRIADTLGVEHLRALAAKGGLAAAAGGDPAERAAKGGAACLERYGTEHYRKMRAARVAKVPVQEDRD